MGNSTYEIFFLNPKSHMIDQIRSCIIQSDFEEIKSDEMKNIWQYKKGNEFVDLALCQDNVGQYIIMVCEGIPNGCLRERMSICPVCSSDNLQVSILYCWRNHLTDLLLTEGKLKYGPGAYDRHGTRPETHKCLKCGCKWHNGAAMFYWNEIIKQGGVLTKKYLGL